MDTPDVVQEEPACPGHRCDVLGEGHHSEVPGMRLRCFPLVK